MSECIPWGFRVDSSNCAQNLELGLKCQAVTGLRFRGRGSAPQHPFGMLCACRKSSSSDAFAFFRRSTRFHRRPRQSARKSRPAIAARNHQPIAAKHQMGMRIDEPGHNTFASASIVSVSEGISALRLSVDVRPLRFLPSRISIPPSRDRQLVASPRPRADVRARQRQLSCDA